jgi:DNA primase
MSQIQNGAQLVKDAADIVEVINEVVPLQNRSGRFLGLCPFHSEKTPSFTVNKDRGFFHCFGCKESGDVISFVMKYHNLSFVEALQELAGRYGIELESQDLSPEEKERVRKRECLFHANEAAATIYHEFLLTSPQAQVARDYLQGRGIPEAIIKEFRLGFAPDSWDFLSAKLARSNIKRDALLDAGLVVQKEKGGVYDRFRKRLLCPLVNMAGQVSGFGGRIIGEGQPKYLNTPETLVFDKSSILYGLYENKKRIQQAKQCVLVEGNFDMLSMVVADLGHVAAPLGTALTEQHVRQLKRYTSEAVLLFDGDGAGLKAALRSVPFFLREQFPARVALLPAGEDPDTLLQKKGRPALAELIANAIALPDFLFGQLVEQYGLGLEGKVKIIKELQPLMKVLEKDKLQRAVFIAHFSEKLGVDPAEISGHLQMEQIVRKPRVVVDKTAKLPTPHRRFMEFLIVYPQYLEVLVDAGLETFIQNGPGQIILDEMTASVHDFSPELLMSKLEGPLRDFVAELLVAVPSTLPDQAEETAMHMVAWLKKQQRQQEDASLGEQINHAHQANNIELYMELLKKKNELTNW